MKGGPSHEYCLEQLANLFEEKGLSVALNAPSRSGGKLIGYCDLVVGDGAGGLLCVEVERSPKRIFNDKVGLTAARYEGKDGKGYLQQVYERDTGEKMWDISAPVYVKGRHWGAFRIGYQMD